MTQKVVGFTCGAFDLLHVGHIHLLAYCKTKCDTLIVGLHTDPTIDRPTTKNKPIQSMYERYYQLGGSRFVDSIIPYDTELDLLNMLSTIDINVRFVGSDYIDKPITGSELCKELGIKIEYVPRAHTYSSTDLRARILLNSMSRDYGK